MNVEALLQELEITLTATVVEPSEPQRTAEETDRSSKPGTRPIGARGLPATARMSLWITGRGYRRRKGADMASKNPDFTFAAGAIMRLFLPDAKRLSLKAPFVVDEVSEQPVVGGLPANLNTEGDSACQKQQ